MRDRIQSNYRNGSNERNLKLLKSENVVFPSPSLMWHTKSTARTQPTGHKKDSVTLQPGKCMRTGDFKVLRHWASMLFPETLEEAPFPASFGLCARASGCQHISFTTSYFYMLSSNILALAFMTMLRVVYALLEAPSYALGRGSDKAWLPTLVPFPLNSQQAKKKAKRKAKS